jgi:hypothetical protein
MTMQPIHRGLRAILAVALAAGFGAGALAQPAAAADPPLAGTYRLADATLYQGQTASLDETSVVGDDAPPVFIFRHLNWGDGTPVHMFGSAEGTPQRHVYAQPGTYEVSVHLTNLDLEAEGTFPDGNTVTVAGPPGRFALDRTSATITRPKTKATARIAISEIPADVQNVRINWGDGKSTTAPRGTSSVSHAYGTGTFKITAAVANDNGRATAKAVGTFKVTQRAAAPAPPAATPPPDSDDDDGNGGGELAITGPGVGPTAGAGAALVLLGFAAFLLTRRRIS